MVFYTYENLFNIWLNERQNLRSAFPSLVPLPLEDFTAYAREEREKANNIVVLARKWFWPWEPSKRVWRPHRWSADTVGCPLWPPSSWHVCVCACAYPPAVPSRARQSWLLGSLLQLFTPVGFFPTLSSFLLSLCKGRFNFSSIHSLCVLEPMPTLETGGF